MKNILYRIIKMFRHWWYQDVAITMFDSRSNLSYVVKYSGNAKASDCLPMLIALHGDGDSANNFYEAALDQFKVPARIILFEAPILHECGRVWPYSPAQYEEHGQAFCEAVDQLAIKYATVNKPVLLGFSGGGAMAYYQAVKHGDSYSYIFPISGLLLNEQLGRGTFKSNAKVYAYHGKSDEVVPFSAAKKAVKILKKHKVCVSFTAFESGHQGMFSNMKAEITQTVEEKLDKLLRYE